MVYSNSNRHNMRIKLRLPNDYCRCASETCPKADTCARAIRHLKEDDKTDRGYQVVMSDMTEQCDKHDYTYYIDIYGK